MTKSKEQNLLNRSTIFPEMMKTSTGATGNALIIDQRTTYSIEVCRSLARLGYAVDVFAEALSPVLRSKFCRTTLSKILPGLVMIVLLGAGCAAGSSSVYPTGSVTTLMWGWEHHFSLEWTVAGEPERGGERLLSGYVYNHHGEFALSVRVLVQALDPNGAVVGQRIEWVPQGVGGFGRSYFEVPHLPPADNYRVTVWEYTWRQSDGAMR